MGCGDTCPVFPGVSYRDRVLEDPAGKGVESVRPIRGEIKARVEAKLTPLQRDTASAVGGAGIRGVVWVEPRYVGEVASTGCLPSRHPTSPLRRANVTIAHSTELKNNGRSPLASGP